MLFVLPGAFAPAYGQEKEPEKQQQAKPAPEPAKPAPQQAKPALQPAKPAAEPQHAQQQAKPAQQPAKPAAEPQHAQQQAKPAQQPAKPAEPQHAQQQAKPAQQQAKPAQQARPGQTASAHGSIPQDRFRASFGSGHTFHVDRADFAGGGGRFKYGGFWFSAVNPWPVGWLYTDNVYVDYINGGYFLCDPIHPGVYLSINVG
jgi:flagellar motor protein MotB